MKKQKALTLISMMVVLLLILISGCQGGTPEKSIQGGQETEKVFTLVGADMTPPTSATVAILEWWASEIEKRTNSQVQSECYWGGSLIGAYEQLEAVKMGNIDFTPYYSGYHPDLAPLPLIALLPLMNIGSLEDALIAADELFRTHPALQEEFKGNNVKYLYPVYNPDAFIWSRNRPINSSEDLKGMNIRAFGPWLTFFEVLGASPISLPVPEVYDALDRGAVDADIMFLPNATGNKYWEVTKYVNITNLGTNVGCPAVMNLDTWNSLPSEIQQVIEQVSKEAIATSVEVNKEFYARDMDAIREHGMEITEFSAADVEKMQQIAKESVWEPYADGLEKKGIPGKDVLNTYLKLLNK